MTLAPKANGFEIRLRYGKGKRDRFLLATLDEAVALEREPRMERMARKLSAAGDGPGALLLLREAAAAAGDAKRFASVERVVDKVCAEQAQAHAAPAVASYSTFRQIAQAWTSGELARDWEDYVAPKDPESRKEDAAVMATFLPALGDKAVDELTDEDIDTARRLIPKGKHPNTRRKYLLRLRTVLRIAVRLKFADKAPEIVIPRRKPSNLFGYLYPQEEALLIAHTGTPLLYRVLYGYLARNGCRIGETVQLTWDHIDLETGDIHIDKRWTKTKKARRWVLDADVFEALEAWHRHQGCPKGEALVFPGRGNKHITAAAVTRRLIGDLKAAGVSRKSILSGGDGISPIRLHDLRASFVTLALRAGRDLKWIMTRTGHETLDVLQQYDRLVRDAEEHHLPSWFEHMAKTIPELRPPRQGGPSLGQTPETAGFMGSNDRPPGTAEPAESGQKPAEIATSVTAEAPLPTASGPASFPGVGQTAPSGPGQAGAPPESTDAALIRIEESLAADLKALIAAGRYELADKVMAELRERRLQRSAPAVTSLSDRRKERKP